MQVIQKAAEYTFVLKGNRLVQVGKGFSLGASNEAGSLIMLCFFLRLEGVLF